ncbi:MAG: class I SAM-dependent methyltransferase, partial [Myxococcota bacterium]
MSYAFGDSALAARRLDLVADVFEPATRGLLARDPVVSASLEGVCDLGCAHGRTTALLVETLGAERTVGLEQSEAFLALARQRAGARVAFHRHDVTQTPFPGAPYDLLFSRLLLTHLKDAPALLERWASELRPGGLLLLDEVEW